MTLKHILSPLLALMFLSIGIIPQLNYEVKSRCILGDYFTVELFTQRKTQQEGVIRMDDALSYLHEIGEKWSNNLC